VRALLVVVLWISATRPGVTQTTAPRPAPTVPPTAVSPAPTTSPLLPLLRARTAYLVNNAGARQPFDEVTTAMRRWGHWRLVDRAEAADLVVSLAPGPIAPTARGRTVKPQAVEYQLSIQSRGNTNATPLWRDVDRKPGRLVERLRDEVEGSPSFCFAVWCR
jgi:hypothetical protein